MATAVVAASALGDNTIVAAVTGKKITLRRWNLSALTANNVKWRSGTTDISGLFYMAATQTIPGQATLETVAGQPLVLNLSAATAIGGTVEYTLD